MTDMDSFLFKLCAPITFASILFDITFLKFISPLDSHLSTLLSSSSHFLSKFKFLYASPIMMKSPSNEIDVARFYTPFGMGCGCVSFYYCSLNLYMMKTKS